MAKQKQWTASSMGRKGGKARAALHSKRELREFAKNAGRKPKLTGKEWKRLFAKLDAGRTQHECAREFGISTRTIGRGVARRKAGGAK